MTQNEMELAMAQAKFLAAVALVVLAICILCWVL